MKKTVCWVGMGFLFVMMTMISCAPIQKTIIATSNLPLIKGTYEGWADFGIGQSRPVLTQVRISNDTVPIQGSITFNNVPEKVAAAIPADTKTAGNDITVLFTDGKISNQGTLIAQSGKDFFELTYYGGEKPKIEGWFYYWALKGTFSVTKK